MRKAIIFLELLSLLLFPRGMYAQNWTVTACSGGPPSTTFSSTYGPMYSVSAANAISRTAVIYPASQLSGISAKTLESIYFHRAGTGGAMAGTPMFKVYLKEVTDSDFGSIPRDWAKEIAAATLVYSGNPVVSVGDSIGWKEFTFSNHFFYSGNQNLAVYMEYQNDTASLAITWTYEFNAPCINTSVNTTIYTNTTSGIFPSSLSTTNYRRPYIGFDFNNSLCISPPTAGIATASKTMVCPGENFTLRLSGMSIGTGQSYQWESSSDTVNWTAITGATAIWVDTSIQVSQYYRCAVMCGGDTTYTPIVKVLARGSLLGGSYTVNPSLPSSATNFNSISEAVDAINCGISGPVIIDVTPNFGPYDERISLGSIPGSSSTNTVTFNGNGATLLKGIIATGIEKRYIVQLNGSEYVIIDGFNLVIDPRSSLGFNIHLTAGASHNIIRNNTLTNSTNSTNNQSFVGIAFSGDASPYATSGIFSHNIIENNTIIGGYLGIRISGESGNASVSNQIRDNNVWDSYSTGISISRCDSTLIRANNISRPTRTNTGVYSGISVGTAFFTIIEKNRIHDPFKSFSNSTYTFHGISVINTNSRSGDFVVKNNLIYNINSNGAQYGLVNTLSDSIDYFNNTIVFDDSNALSIPISSGFYSGSGISLGVQIMNNVFYITRRGIGTRIGQTWLNAGCTYNSNFNNFYINGGSGIVAVGGKSEGPYATLADWQMTGSDLNSYDVDPDFANRASGDFLCRNQYLRGTGAPLSNVTDDILGTSRIGSPDIGAFETFKTLNDIAVIALLTPQEPLFAGVENITVRVMNTGANAITSFTLNWTINGLAGTPFEYTGLLLPGHQIDTVIAAPNFNAGLANILVWTSNPNGTADTYSANDSVSAKVYVCGTLNGNYTINKNAEKSNTNFHSINDFVSKLHDCGIEGTVNVYLADGTYEEQIVIDSIPGISSSNRVNFYSLSGDSSLVTISYPSSINSSAEDYVIKFNNAQYISLNQLGVHRTGQNVYATIIKLSGETKNIAFHNNLLVGIRNEVSSGSRRQSAIFAEDGSKHDSLVIVNNTIIGGKEGVCLDGAVNISKKAKGLHIEGNVISTAYYGVYIANHFAPLVSKNIISRGEWDKSSNRYTGIMTEFISHAAEYSYNKISVQNGGYGIHLKTSIASVSNEVKIINNFINTVGDTYSMGINIEGTVKYLNIANNSVLSIGKQSLLSRALNIVLLDTLSNNINLYNNIFVNEASAGYAIYVSNLAVSSISNSDYNNVYTNGNYFCYWGQNTSSLQDFITVSQKNLHSYSVNPNFFSNTELRTNSLVLNNHGLPLSYVTNDIDGELRDVNTPDIGADEYTPADAEIVAVKILYPGTMQEGCGIPNDSIVFIIRNTGALAQSNFDVKADITGSIVVDLVKTVLDTLQPGEYDTLSISGYDSRVIGLSASMQMKVYSDLITDVKHSNDTLIMNTLLNSSADTPTIVSVEEVCSGSSGLISVNSSATDIKWYDVPVGGTVLGDSASFITPPIYTSTTYYVEARYDSLKTYSVGHVSTAGTSRTISQTQYHGLGFKVHAPVKIDTVHIFPMGTGTIIIHIFEAGTMNLVYSSPVANVSGNGSAFNKTPVYVGAYLLPGEYRITMTSTGSLNLGREITGTQFPYISPPITINHSTTSALTGTTTTEYRWFYDWKISTGAISCPSVRVPVRVSVQSVSGSLINKHSPYDGMYNAGTSVSPDEVCVNNILSYQISAPVGYQDSDYNVTWEVINAELRYLSGDTASGVFNISNNTWSYISNEQDADSIIRFTAQVVSKQANCDPLNIERYIRVEHLPNLNIGFDQSICVGDTITLDAGIAAVSYLWNTGDTTQTISVYTAGAYSVVITTPQGCVDVDTIIIQQASTPVVSFSVDRIVNETEVHFTANGAVAGQLYAWNFGDPESGAANTSALPNPIHVFTYKKDYYVTFKITRVISGCVDSVVELVHLSNVESDLVALFHLIAKPNPFSDRTTIAYDLPQASTISIELYDMLGRKVSTLVENEMQLPGKHEIEYSNEDLQSPDGMYMVRLIVDGKGAMIRIIDLTKK